MEIVRQRKKRLLAWILTLVLCVGMWQGKVMAEDSGDTTPTEVTPVDETPTEGSDEALETGNESSGENPENVPMVIADGFTVTVVDSKFEDVGSYIESVQVGQDTAKKSDNIFTFEGGLTQLTSASIQSLDSLYQHTFLGWYNEENEPLKLDSSTSGMTSAKAMFGSTVHIDWGSYASGENLQQDNAKIQSATVNTKKALAYQYTEVEGYQFLLGWGTANSGATLYPNDTEVPIYYNQFEEWIGFLPRYGTSVDYAGTYPLKSGVSFSLGSGSWTVTGDDYIYSGYNEFVVTEEGDYEFKAVE